MDGFRDTQSFEIRRDVAYRAIDGEYHFLTADNYHHAVTDPVGFEVLARIEQGLCFREVIRALLAEYEVEELVLRRDVQRFLEDLVTKGILQAIEAHDLEEEVGV